jgi:RHS repeat-associated protein
VKIESALYKPFGEQSEWLLPGNAAPETKGWIGERFDADAGLQYLNARYYDPELSLFLQPDWFEVTKPGVGTNRFSYSFNDPVNKIDPGGNYSIGSGAELGHDLATKKDGSLNKSLNDAFDWFFGNEKTRTSRHLENARTEFGLAHQAYAETLDPQDEMYQEHLRRAYGEISAIGRSSLAEAWHLVGEDFVDAALGGSLVTSAARATGAAGAETTVFWSGGDKAKAAAAEWAAANGGKTVEMTNVGKALESANLPWEKAKPLWDAASADFARNSSQVVHAFLRDPSVIGIWSRIELPELMRRGVQVIRHEIAP